MNLIVIIVKFGIWSVNAVISIFWGFIMLFTNTTTNERYTFLLLFGVFVVDLYVIAPLIGDSIFNVIALFLPFMYLYRLGKSKA